MDNVFGASKLRTIWSNSQQATSAAVPLAHSPPDSQGRYTSTVQAGGRSDFAASNAVGWDKAKNPIFWAATNNLIVFRHVPDDCLTNGICGLDYRF
jgi:hypothetical protein